MIQAIVIERFFKALFKHPKVMELFDYKDKPNELDLAVEKLNKYRKEDNVKLNAALDLFKSSTEKIDQLSDSMKYANKEVNKIKDTIEKVRKIAHPPAIPLKDINELKESAKDTKWMMGLFKIMKKNPLLKSIFK